MEKENYIEEYMDFEDILNNLLPPFVFEEETILICDPIALKTQKISYDEKNVVQDGVGVKIGAGEYINDFYKEKENGFGTITEEDGIEKVHLGVDVSYGKECVLSCIHPVVYSPVAGVIEKVDETFGLVIIKGCNRTKVINGTEVQFNYFHYIEHLDEINSFLSEGKEVFSGLTKLGTMGGKGAAGRYHYNQHVHYGIKIKAKYFTGNIEHKDEEKGIDDDNDLDNWFCIDPEEFWNHGLEYGFVELEKKEYKESEIKEESKTEEKDEEKNENNEIQEYIIEGEPVVLEEEIVGEDDESEDGD